MLMQGLGTGETVAAFRYGTLFGVNALVGFQQERESVASATDVAFTGQIGISGGLGFRNLSGMDFLYVLPEVFLLRVSERAMQAGEELGRPFYKQRLASL